MVVGCLSRIAMSAEHVNDSCFGSSLSHWLRIVDSSPVAGNGVSAHANVNYVMLVSRNSVGLVKHVFVPWGCAILTELLARDCKAGNSVKV